MVKSSCGKNNWNVVTMLKMFYIWIPRILFLGSTPTSTPTRKEYITNTSNDFLGEDTKNLNVLIEINEILLKYFMQKSPMVTFLLFFATAPVKRNGGKSDILIKLRSFDSSDSTASFFLPFLIEIFHLNSSN